MAKSLLNGQNVMVILNSKLRFFATNHVKLSKPNLYTRQEIPLKIKLT